ncbi:MAG: hypothetical protein NZ480_09585 [Bdellovibrionaceae bacterium]|nr:hypothetical protein [Pseudobdellovibrionaceae bacterium]MDW8190701.1 hypothetical protein [Pseudobdellovibrionaceae bacterium]
MSRSPNQVFADFIKAFLLPTLVNKIFMLYFGLKYVEHPGEGYGFGLVITFLFLIFTLGRLIWKYRNVEDP